VSSSTFSSRLRIGLRLKLLAVSLLLIFIPLLVVWAIGFYEEPVHEYHTQQVRELAQTLRQEMVHRKVSMATLNPATHWLHDFARTHHVMLRLVDRAGQIVVQTPAIDAERWSNIQRGWYRRAGDFFFGPSGPPDLLGFEETLLPLAQRPEVQRARAGQEGEIWRSSADRSLHVYYHALPLPEGSAVVLTRVSRRSIRALYEQRYQILKLTLFLSAVAAVMGLWVGWRFVGPIVRIQRTIHAYLDHPTELQPEQLVLRRKDELGDLSRDLQRLTGALRDQLQQTAAVAADLAHDLKNPIATVSASSELLLSGPTIDAQRQERLARALSDAATHMQRSVEGMLQLSHLDQSLAAAKHTAVDLSHLLQQLLTSYRSNPATEHMKLLSSIEEHLELPGLQEQLLQLMRNLLDNALLFGRSTVAVTLAREGAALVLTVNDDGPGISAGNREKVFHRFFSTRPDGLPPGTGLGLAMAQTIVLAHGGEITVEPEGHLPGACLKVKFPKLD
jgi:two-component system, OmpR family, sensor histidine kinase ChvG